MAATICAGGGVRAPCSRSARHLTDATPSIRVVQRGRDPDSGGRSPDEWLDAERVETDVDGPVRRAGAAGATGEESSTQIFHADRPDVQRRRAIAGIALLALVVLAVAVPL